MEFVALGHVQSQCQTHFRFSRQRQVSEEWIMKGQVSATNKSLADSGPG